MSLHQGQGDSVGSFPVVFAAEEDTGAGRAGEAAQGERPAVRGPGTHPHRAGHHGKSARALGGLVRERAAARDRQGRQDVLDALEEIKLTAVAELRAVVGQVGACALVGQSRATAHRRARPVAEGPKPRRTRASPASKLTDAEAHRVLQVLTSPRFAEASVAQTWATLLDEGTYLCSQSTMHRLLRAHGAAGDRRRQATHPPRARPELTATAPGQVWSWDITKVKGPDRGTWYDLYVLIDIYSRYVVGWTIAATEKADIAEDMIARAVATHGAPKAVHADRGTSMTSKPVAALLAELAITKSHSRPKVSNDNPYSEAHFKTLKYAPDFPDRFGSLPDARAHCEAFFAYYNHEHRHTGIGLHTPASVHHGTATKIRQQRAATLEAAYAAHPDRFARPPTPPAVPEVAWINQPTVTATDEQHPAQTT